MLAMPPPFVRLTLAWAWLGVWAATYQALPCLVVLLLALPVIMAIMLGMLESALLRRRALVGMYLEADGGLYRWLRGGLLMVSWQTLKALGFALVLLMAATQWESRGWLILGVDALCLWAGYAWLCRVLAAQVKPPYSAMFARHVLVFLNTLVFAVVIAGAEFYLPHPDYREVSLADAIYYEVSQVEAACDVVGILARGALAGQTLSWWLAESWLSRPELSALAGLGWLLFLAGSTAFMWAYSRLLLGMLVSPERLFGILGGK
jgi:hypothetical protein